MKALLAFGIVGCIIAGMLAGCTSSGSQQISPSNPLVVDASGEEPTTPSAVIPESMAEESASLQITNIYQDYYEDIDEWRTFVRFDYEVRNTGSVDIDYYEVAFIAECADGQEFHDWHNGSDIMVGSTITKEFLINVGGIEVVDILIEDWGFAPDSVNHEVTEPELELSALFKIEDWEQPYYDSIDQYGFVEIFYEVENTGDLDIDYYEVYFTVECSGGKEYTEWTNGTNVKVGRTYSDSIMVDVGDREARDVEIDDWDLTSY